MLGAGAGAQAGAEAVPCACAEQLSSTFTAGKGAREMRTVGSQRGALCKQMDSLLLCCVLQPRQVPAPRALQQVPSTSSQLGILAIMSQPRLKRSELSKAQANCTPLISHTLG